MYFIIPKGTDLHCVCVYVCSHCEVNKDSEFNSFSELHDDSYDSAVGCVEQH